jgi:hypothetical protein
MAPDGGGGSSADAGDDTNVKTGDATGTGDPSNSGVTFSAEQQAELDRILRDRLTRARKQWEADAEDAEKKAREEAEAQRLKEQEQYKELAEKREQELKDLKSQLAVEQHQRLQFQIAQDVGLPPEMADRIQGEDEAAMREDAKSLAKFVAADDGQGSPPGPNPKPPTSTTQEDLVQRKRRSGSYGVI